METVPKFYQFFIFMGPWKWLLILLSLFVFVLICIKIYDYYVRKQPSKRFLNSILFWGIITAVTGMIGQVSGLWASLNMIMSARDISPTVIMIGYLSSFVTTLYGLGVLFVAGLSWWGLKHKNARLMNK